MYKMANDSNNSNTNKKRVSKKGILLTALIVAGIIGTSFIVYFIPQLSRYLIGQYSKIWLMITITRSKIKELSTMSPSLVRRVYFDISICQKINQL